MAYQIDQQYCSCCHRCRVLCPVQAIQFKNAKYWIDPAKCIECGLCAKNCHNGIISKIGEVPAAPASHDPIHRDADLVVVGGGGSGMVCAVKFAQMTGKKVIVLEKGHEIGGNTWYASGFRIHYSDLQRKAGAPDNREKEIREFMMGVLQQEDPQLIHNVFYATERFQDWLIADCDCAEDFVLGHHPFAGPMVQFVNKTGKQYKRIDCSIGPGGTGSFIIEKMEKAAKNLNIEIITNCAGEHLIQDETGAVTGIIANDGGGTIEISAKAVVLATGCFSHNKELLEKVQPSFFDSDCVPVHRFSVPTCTGDGVRMCIEAGAEIDYENTHCLILGPARHPYSFSLVNLIREPQTILVNTNGVRFGNEQDNTMGMRKVLAKQPHRCCWAITNDAMLAEEVKSNAMSPMGQGEAAEIVSHWKEDLEHELAIGAECASADTLEELAEKIDMPADALVAQIARYNASCAAGYDSEFFKDPRFLFPLEGGPYYALRCQTFQENAVGGTKIDSKVRVLKPDGTPIPNLYAVGDNTRGVRVAGDVGADLVERTITNLTWCMASGYMAAENIAETM